MLIKADNLKETLRNAGFCLYGCEPLKITIQAKSCGYTGTEFAQYLLTRNIVCEFADEDNLVLMVTPGIGEADLERLEDALSKKAPLQQCAPVFRAGERVLSIREAMLSLSEPVPVSESEGRVLANPSVGCPPAVPILVWGERIDRYAMECFRYYGIDHVAVVCEKKGNCV